MSRWMLGLALAALFVCWSSASSDYHGVDDWNTNDIVSIDRTLLLITRTDFYITVQ